VYVWKTLGSWNGQCMQLLLQLNDGTSQPDYQRVNFKFTK